MLAWAYAEQRARSRLKTWVEKTPQEKLANYLAGHKAYREAALPLDTESWKRMSADPRIKIGDAGGNCPVQIHLEVDDHSAYFRARGSHWSFQVAMPEYFAPCADDNTLFQIERHYGDWPSAGWMTMEEAATLLEQAIEEFRHSTSKLSATKMDDNHG